MCASVTSGIRDVIGTAIEMMKHDLEARLSGCERDGEQPEEADVKILESIRMNTYARRELAAIVGATSYANIIYGKDYFTKDGVEHLIRFAPAELRPYIDEIMFTADR